MLSAALPLSVMNGHNVRREDSRVSLFMDPGTPDSVEVTLFHPFYQYFYYAFYHIDTSSFLFLIFTPI